MARPKQADGKLQSTVFPSEGILGFGSRGAQEDDNVPSVERHPVAAKHSISTGKPRPADSNCRFVSTRTNTYIDVYQGDTTTLQVDAIVSASHTDLDAQRGVAQPIADAAGFTVGQELTITRQSKIVIHAVSPLCNTTTPDPGPERLRATFENIFKVAQSRKFKSMAISGIAEGMGKCSLKVVADTFFHSLQDYLNSEFAGLKEIHIVDLNAEVVEHIRARLVVEADHQVWIKYAESMRPPPSPRAGLRENAGSDLPTAAQAAVMTGDRTPTPPDRHHTEDRQGYGNDRPGGTPPAPHNFRTTRRNTLISVYVGDIATLKVNAVVMARDASRKPRKCSQALAQAAGPEVQRALATPKSNLVTPHCQVTTAGRLSCNSIIHTMTSVWNTKNKGNREAQKLLKSTLANIMKICKERHFTSIAMPAILSGRTDGSMCEAAAVTAACLQTWTVNHDKDREMIFPAEIHLVDYETEIVESMQQALVKEAGKNTWLVEQGTSRPMTAVGAGRGGHGQGVIDASPRADQRLAVASEGNVHPMEFTTMNNTKVSVRIDDITKLRVNIIVNAANEKLRHGGGVARAIADAAGSELIKESRSIIKKNGEVPVCSHVLTSAGNLPCEQVMHAVGPRWKAGIEAWCQSQLQETFRNIFNYALTTSSCCSIAVPAISSGIFGASREEVVWAMVSALRTCVVTHGKHPTTLRELHLVDIVPAMVGSIQEALATEAKRAGWIHLDGSGSGYTNGQSGLTSVRGAPASTQL